MNTEDVLHRAAALFYPDKRIFIGYLLTAGLMAFVAYRAFLKRPEAQRPDMKAGFFPFLFDRDVWGHTSARQDYLFFLVNAAIYYVVVGPFLLGQEHVTLFISRLLTTVFGPVPVPLLDGAESMILYTLAVVVAVDLAAYGTHYLQHRSSLLWHFHKVHHSAEVLTPVTLYRMHPIDLAVTSVAISLLVGAATAVFIYLSGQKPAAFTLFGVNAVIFLFYVFGYNLRHSHVWVGFPRWLSHLLISPAQHQIHHSVALQHRDKNMGLLFGVWDWMFGTLYVPKGYEKIACGVSEEERNPFASVLELYALPFLWAWRDARDKLAQSPLGVGSAFVFRLLFAPRQRWVEW